MVAMIAEPPNTHKTASTSAGKKMHYSAGVIVEFEDRFLLVDRLNPPLGFASVAGHIDVTDESPLTAIIRELQEEAGIIVTDPTKVTQVAEEEIPWNECRTAPSHHWYLFRLRVHNATVIWNKKECASIGWFTRDQLKHKQLEPVWEYWFKKFRIL